MCEYTGRYRFRTRRTIFLNEILVLQIEIICKDYDPIRRQNETLVLWRDATPTDLRIWHNSEKIEWTEIKAAITKTNK